MFRLSTYLLTVFSVQLCKTMSSEILLKSLEKLTEFTCVIMTASLDNVRVKG